MTDANSPTSADAPAIARGPIAVTGGTGYVAAWVIHELLSRGFSVHATARSLEPDKIGWLEAMALDLPGALRIFAADLLQPDSFAPAFEGCHAVIHTASPFVLGKIKDPQAQLVTPALEGTRNVLGAVSEASSVTRVVLTSSIAATIGYSRECEERGGIITEDHWNESSSLHEESYPFSKAEAEREAWRIAEAQDHWRLVVINPGFVMGPAIPATRRSGASISFMRHTIDGTWRIGVPKIELGLVDVRDVAHAHVEAALRDDAEGRHLVVADSCRQIEMGRMIAEALGDRVRVPAREVSKIAMYVAGPLNGYSVRWVHRTVGYPLRFDNTRSRERLGMKYRPLRDTLVEHAEQLLASA